jgi:hypothetical protein
MKEKSLNLALMIGAMVGLLALAFVFDISVQALVGRNTTQGGLEQWLVWLFPLCQLLLMVVTVGLVWLMVSSGGFSRLVSAIYILFGLLILYSTSLLLVLPVPESTYFIFEYISPGTFLYQASGAVAAIGIISLAMWKPAKPVEYGPEAAQEPDSGSVDDVDEAGAAPTSSIPM